MQNLQEKRGSKWSNPVNLERILVEIGRVWAHLSAVSSSLSAKAVQNDHITSPCNAFSASRLIPAARQGGRAACRFACSIAPSRPSPSHRRPSAEGLPDEGYEAIPHLTRLRDRLAAALAAANRDSGRKPPIFFFDKRRQAEFAESRQSIPAESIRRHLRRDRR